MSVAFCYLRVVGRGFARVILPELLLDRSGFKGDALSCTAAVLVDIGIAMDLSFDLCKQEILARELVPVLNGWHRAPRDMNIVMSEQNEENAQLVQFAKWLADREIIDNKARWAPMFLRFGGNQAE